MSANAVTTANKPRSERSPTAEILRRFRRHRLAMVGVIILGVIVFASVFAPWLTPYEPNRINLRDRSQPPSMEHWLGTDRTGRDILTRLLYAGRISLAVGVAAVAISLVVGTLLGAVAGHFGGLVDSAIMRAVDVVMTFPSIIVLLSLAAIVGPGIVQTILIVGLLGSPIPCRLVRSRMLSLREQEFVTAARGLGASDSRIILKHLLPNSIDVLIVYATLGIASAILLEAGLSFLGLGVQPPTASWGNMINVARNISYLEGYPWEWMPAGVAIVLTVLAINFIGDGLRDAFDPRSKH
ncbi:MAG: ABC transporter permease [Meiothermus sp.]|nr:ABC transporter permease [Meiothermus sp.]